MDISSFIDELKRRRVFRVLVGYGVVAFTVLQILEPIMHGLHLPDEVLTYGVVLLGLGLPVALMLAWAFDVTPGGIERTPAAPAMRGAKLPVVLGALGILLAAPGVAWYLLRARPAAAPLPHEGPPSIAALPFVNLSADKDQDYFSDGLTEEILNALAQVDGLQVAGRTSSFAFKGKNEDLRSIGAQLGVANVLEGSVRKAGNRVRITAQIIKVSDGFDLWSQTFDRELTDIFAVQEEIAQAVVSVMRVKLLPGQQAVPANRRAVSPEAYAQYLLGNELMREQTFAGYQRAQAAYEKAVALQPEYGPALAGLSSALSWVANSDPDLRVDRLGLQARALAEAEKAIAAAPDLPDGWAARGTCRLGFRWDWEGAKADLTRAHELAPGDAIAMIWFGHLQAVQGQVSDAIATTRKAAQLDPLSPVVWDLLGRYLSAAGDLPAARAAFQRSLSIAPEDLWSRRELAITYLLSGEPAVALASFEKQTGWLRDLGRALALHDLGKTSEAQGALHDLSAQPDPPMYQVAQVYAWWGDLDRAFASLHGAIDTHDAGLRYVKYDPLLRKLRGDARYAALMRELKLPVE